MKKVPDRQLRNHERLANIEPVQVAQIAATLLRDGDDEIEAIRKAYRLLDVAEHCKVSLKTQASVEAGIKNYQDGVRKDDEFYATLEKIPQYDYEIGPEGKRASVRFDEGLEKLILLSPQTKDKPSIRMTWFKRFLSAHLQKTHPKLNEQERIIRAGEMIEEMKRDGIDPGFFDRVRIAFPSWKEETEKSDLSAQGKLGADRKKSKQGRVKSPSDRRKRARPPLEKMGEILKKAHKGA